VLLVVVILYLLLRPKPCSELRPEWCDPSAAAMEPRTEWGGDYNSTPADLCPPDKEATARPVFQDAVEQEEYEGMTVWVRQGLLANEQGELFRVEVIGPGRDAVQVYTDEVKVCFDQVLVGEETSAQPDSSQPGSPLPEDVLESNPRNLIVNINFIGVSSEQPPLAMYEVAVAEEAAAVEQGPEVTAVVEVAQPTEVPAEPPSTIEDIVSQVPASDWLEALQQSYPDLSLASAQEWVREYQEDFVVDFIIDPPINSGECHDYPSTCKQSTTATISVGGGAGGVSGYLYRNYAIVLVESVSKGGDESATLSDSSAPEFSTYDLGVWGDQNGSRYRVSGRWWYSYGAYAPSGGGWSCPP
jgi:hypothetical protein